MKYYILNEYDGGSSILFDNLDKAMDFIKEMQKDDIEEYGEVMSSFGLVAVERINPSYEEWKNETGQDLIMEHVY